MYCPSLNWVDHSYHSDVGGLHIRPSEVILKQEALLRPAVDIWALGRLVYTVFCCFACVLHTLQVFNLLTSSDLFRLPSEDKISENLMDRIHLWWILRLLEIPVVPVPLIDGGPHASELLLADGMIDYSYLLVIID